MPLTVAARLGCAERANCEAALISLLDIFALRARSREAKMQVELAQLEYLLPRLTRMWVHLSRIRGGIGLRGPGETQLETDRRMIRRKIGVLKGKLEEVAEHRGRLRARSRDRGVVRVALVGYTNAGKSSLLKALTGADAHVEDRLFATLDTESREVQVNGQRLRFTDTQQKDILNHFIRGGDITAGGVMHAVTSVARTLDDADTAHEMESQALRALEAAATL